MRKLVLKMSVSADGFVCGPNGEIDWLLRTRDQSAFDWIEKTLWDAGVHIMGSRTFHDMVAYWPTSPDPLAVPMNEIPKVVFSKKGFVEQTRDELTTQAFKDSSRQDAEKGIVKTTISKSAGTWSEASIASDIVSDITKLKQQDGKFILAHGGASFAQDLVKHELIDEYRLVIHPVILGKGIPLFALAPNPIELKLESSSHFDSGIIANIYSTIVK
ncbi:dihydrofolate reductase family protein [Chryseobacterium paludis]|uniref:dihydrofolate reductase family protein n=1 Tax=Chryseobacterium paludis TaxID=2956784 RepID=UPI0036F1CA54